MKLTIDHFMWGYQTHFRIAQQSAAERVFRLLDERFRPEIFLVGVLVEARQDRHRACVEPEKDFWALSDEFTTVIELAQQIESEYPEREMMHSHPLAQEWHDSSLKRRAIRDAVQKILSSRSNRPPGMSYFASIPSKVDGYLVCVVLGLQTEVLDAYPQLSIKEVPIHEYRSFSVSTSFIDAVVATYLQRTSGELLLPDPGSGLGGPNAEEVLREAASTLTMELAYRADPNCYGGWHSLFSSCNRIAAAYYEKLEVRGTMLLAARDHTAITNVVRFSSPPRLSVTRAARKLLQLASQDLALHTDSALIYGLVRLGSYKEGEEKFFKIHFLGHHHWEISHAGKILMRVKYGDPYVPKPTFDEDKLRKDIPRLFGTTPAPNIELIVNLVRQAAREAHGTMLVISANAKEEAHRLKSQAIAVAAKPLTPKLLRNLTPIDGAVLLNAKGTCYAVGTILDGMATSAGNPARGARYNSALRYVEASGGPCLAIVISEDGGVDFIPDLKPMVRESDILAAIAVLDDVSRSPVISRSRFHGAIDWLYNHNFYLLPHHCTRINSLRTSIEQRLQTEDPTAVRIIREDIKPNEGLNAAMYYESEQRTLIVDDRIG